MEQVAIDDTPSGVEMVRKKLTGTEELKSETPFRKYVAAYLPTVPVV